MKEGITMKNKISEFDKRKYEYAIEKFREASGINDFETDGIHAHVLKDFKLNFNGYDDKPKLNGFKLHKYAASLTSSQAFAYNVFSDFLNVKFEYRLYAIERHNPAQIDVAIKNDKSSELNLYEIKMFEEIEAPKGINFHWKYFDITLYPRLEKAVAEKYIEFIKRIRKTFGDREDVYGYGLKQLCCHILGILNETGKNGKLFGKYKKINLFSLCFDGWDDSKFEDGLCAYKGVLKEFQKHASNFLSDIGLSETICYCGYMGSTEFISNNKSVSEYAKKRYCR